MKHNVKPYGAPKWWESYIGAPILLALFLGGIFLVFSMIENI